jgi:type 1 fimbriae regulatory protein FimB
MRTYTNRRPPGFFTKFPDHPVILLDAKEATRARNPDMQRQARKQAERVLDRNPDTLYVSVCNEKGKVIETIVRDLPRPVYVRIRKDTGHWRAGQTIEIEGGIEWPGKWHPNGVRRCKQWVFQSSDGPGALLIEASDVEAVIIPRNTITWPKVLKDLPPFGVEYAGRSTKASAAPAPDVMPAATAKARDAADRPRVKGRRASRARRLETIKFLTFGEWGRLFDVIESKRDRALFLIAYRHGLRASEVGLLKRTDFDEKRRKLMVHRLKGSLPGLHEMQPDEVKALKDYLRERRQECERKGVADANPLLFPDRYGGAISRFALDWLMRRKYGPEAGLPKEKTHFHVLKHSIATHLFEAGADLSFVHDWLGHADISNTQLYEKLVSATRDKRARGFFRKLSKL